MWEKDQEISLGHVQFEMSARHPSGDVEQTIRYRSLELEEINVRLTVHNCI